MKNKIVLYHRVMRRESFEKAAKDLFGLLKSAQVKSPNMERVLYVDIDDHRNSEGGYDQDMFELQTEFGINFLGRFFTEVHFPLIDYINPNPQQNDVLEGLKIFCADNKVDNQINELYIENYSNTEFVSEPDVYQYLQKVHDFFVEHRSYDWNRMIHEDSKNLGKAYMRSWKNHIYELINELYNAFIYGNLITVAAMTRTLIECFVYYSILDEPGNEQLIHHWFICNMCCTMQSDDKLRELIQGYCVINGLDFEEMWKIYAKDPRTKRWLKQVLPDSKTLNFEEYCKYLGSTQIYDDYVSACAFVHGQDMISKLLSFTFYVSICNRFHMMMTYVFGMLRKFALNESLELKLTELEDELNVLIENYCE